MSSARSTYVPSNSPATATDRVGSDPVSLDPPVAFHPIESLYRGTPQSGLPARARHYEPALRPPTGVEGYGWLFRPECGSHPVGVASPRRSTVDEDTMAWSLDPDPTTPRAGSGPVEEHGPLLALPQPDRPEDRLRREEVVPGVAEQGPAASGHRRCTALLVAGLVGASVLAPSLLLLPFWW